MPELSAKFTNMGFLCACLVVLIHVGILPEDGGVLWWVKQMFTHLGVTRIAVPFFFLASGFFLAGHMGDRGWYLQEVKKRVKTLLLPYLLWNMIYLVFMIALEMIASRIGYKPHIPIPAHGGWGDIFNASGLNVFRPSAHIFLWFVRCLFIFVLLSPLIDFIVRRIGGKIVFVLAFISFGLILRWGLSCGNSFIAWVLQFGYSIEGLYYFMIGIYLRRYSGEKQLSHSVGTVVFAAGIMLYAVRAVCAYNHLSLFEFWSGWIGTAVLMCGIWSLMPTRVVIGVFRGCAFPIYILHQFVLILMMGALGFLAWRDYVIRESVALYFGRMVIVVVLVWAFLRVLERVAPRLTLVLFGGRT